MLAWYHRQFMEAASARYLSIPDVAASVHSAIADYFLGKWAGKTLKPFRHDPSRVISCLPTCEACLDEKHFCSVLGADTRLQMQRLKVKHREDKAARYCAEQPLYFESPAGRRYNVRKLSELPYHLLRAGRHQELISECLANFHFLLAKMEVCFCCVFFVP